MFIEKRSEKWCKGKFYAVDEDQVIVVISQKAGVPPQTSDPILGPRSTGVCNRYPYAPGNHIKLNNNPSMH